MWVTVAGSIGLSCGQACKCRTTAVYFAHGWTEMPIQMPMQIPPMPKMLEENRDGGDVCFAEWMDTKLACDSFHAQL